MLSTAMPIDLCIDHLQASIMSPRLERTISRICMSIFLLISMLIMLSSSHLKLKVGGLALRNCQNVFQRMLWQLLNGQLPLFSHKHETEIVMVSRMCVCDWNQMTRDFELCL